MPLRGRSIQYVRLYVYTVFICTVKILPEQVLINLGDLVAFLPLERRG
ncbi:MAG: hypothetical protein ACI910_001200 [Oleispira sp.]|jgi:hypothetical protein